MLKKNGTQGSDPNQSIQVMSQPSSSSPSSPSSSLLSAVDIVMLAASRICIRQDQLDDVIQKMSDECVTEGWQIPHLDSFNWQIMNAPVGLVASVRVFVKENPELETAYPPTKNKKGPIDIDTCEPWAKQSNQEETKHEVDSDVESDSEMDVESELIPAFNPGKRRVNPRISDLSIDISFTSEEMRLLEQIEKNDVADSIENDDRKDITPQLMTRKTSLFKITTSSCQNLPDFPCVKPSRKVSRDLLLEDFSPEDNGSTKNATWPTQTSQSRITRNSAPALGSNRNVFARINPRNFRHSVPAISPRGIQSSEDNNPNVPQRRATIDPETVVEIPFAVANATEIPIKPKRRATIDAETDIDIPIDQTDLDLDEDIHEEPYNDEAAENILCEKRLANEQSRMKLAEAFQILFAQHQDSFSEVLDMDDNEETQKARVAKVA